MHNSLRVPLLSLFLASGLAVFAQEKSYRITGFVSSVGSDLGTTIDGIDPVFGDADPFEITLTFDAGQTPVLIPWNGGAGMTASYKLLETAITIRPDTGGPLTWSFSSPLGDNDSHSFGIANNIGTNDNFTGGMAGFTFDGPALNGHSFGFWMMTLSDFQGVLFSDTSLFESLNMAELNQRSLQLFFGASHSGVTINLSPQEVALVSASAIPEPSTWAAIAGGVALGLAGWTKRRKCGA